MGTVCRSSVTVSLNYSTEDRRGQALWVETDGLIPLKEEGQRTGAGVAAVGGIKRRDENLLGRIGLAEALGQGLRLLGGIAVGDAHRLVPGVPDQGVVLVGQLPNGLGPPAGFAAQDNAAVWVSLEQGLEAQRRPQHGLGAGETSAPAEVHQVIHREKVGNPVPEGEEGAGGVLQAHPPLPQVEGPEDQ